MKKKASNKLTLRDQIINFFPSYYMTLISIIQATALGYLLLNFSNQLKEEVPDLSLFVIYVITFFVIIIVWYEYMMGSAALRWVPSIWDSLIPFSLGIGQFLLICYIACKENIYYWYFSFSGVCFISFFAYLNMYRGATQLKKKNQNNRMVLKALKKFPVLNYIFTGVYTILFLFFGYYEYLHNNTESVLIIYTTLALTMIFLVRGVLYWHRIIEMIK